MKRGVILSEIERASVREAARMLGGVAQLARCAGLATQTVYRAVAEGSIDRATARVLVAAARDALAAGGAIAA